jgi:hypothetical protein
MLADIKLPPELGTAIEDARAHVEGEMNGTVTLTVSCQSFRTHWATRSLGRPTVDIELTPELRIETLERMIQQSLVLRGTDGGAIWAHPDCIKRLVRWVGGDESMGEWTHCPFSDDEMARRRALHDQEMAGFGQPPPGGWPT